MPKHSTASIEHGATACAPMKMHARLVVWRFYFIPQFVGDTELAGGWLLNGKRNLASSIWCGTRFFSTRGLHPELASLGDPNAVEDDKEG